MAVTVSAPEKPQAAAPRLSMRVAALVGFVSMGAALAAGHFVAGFIGPTASPFLAVGNSAIDMTPLWLKNFAVNTFGTHDKLVLLTGMAVVLLIPAAAARVPSRGQPLPGGGRAAGVRGARGVSPRCPAGRQP